jgi:tetratricopeptide (TPR) repeat protein
MSDEPESRPSRTVLEQLIRERRETFDEFAEFATNFARDCGEPGTLSTRHVKRLASGRGDGGKPLGQPQQATVRLLERIFGVKIDELLAPPRERRDLADDDREFRALLRTSARIDGAVLQLLRDQLNATRRLDRQLGAILAHDEVATKIAQVGRLMGHSVMPTTREDLAALLAELRTLAGWQALDLGNVSQSWRHYEQGKLAANELSNPAFAAHTSAGQAFVLLDIGDSASAVELMTTIRRDAERKTDRSLRSWLAAAHGEALAADGQRVASLRAFDQAAALLPENPAQEDGPYLALDSVHLGRWRGHALARVGEPEAIDVLSESLDRLDPTFVRAETALRVDLATAFVAAREREQARMHVGRARTLAADIGSARQHRRLERLKARVQ